MFLLYFADDCPAFFFRQWPTFLNDNFVADVKSIFRAMSFEARRNLVRLFVLRVNLHSSYLDDNSLLHFVRDDISFKSSVLGSEVHGIKGWPGPLKFGQCLFWFF